MSARTHAFEDGMHGSWQENKNGRAAFVAVGLKARAVKPEGPTQKVPKQAVATRQKVN